LNPPPATLEAQDRSAVGQLADQLRDVADTVSQPAAKATIVAAATLLKRLAEPQQKGTAPFAPLRIAGDDPRLKAPYGERLEGSLRVAGAAARRCHVLYGPYVALPAGSYRFELKLSAVDCGPGPVIVDLCHRQGNRQLYSRPCLPWEFENRAIRISCALEQPVEDLELRLTAGPGFSAVITELSITQRS
jgi:hypothetical protein